MSDVITRIVYNSTDRTREIQFVSRNKPIKMIMNIKETNDRVIITRRMTFKNKTIKKIEIFDIE
jgi:hypothetical protein